MINIVKLLAVAVLFVCFNAWSFDITSAAFDDGAPIPARYTCDSINISPPLSWSDVPIGTKSLALIMYDMDSRKTRFNHWIVYNIPKDSHSFDEYIPNDATLDDGTMQGVNDQGGIGYYGPCPPQDGPHRYMIKLLAVDMVLNPRGNPDADDIAAVLKGNVIDVANIMGTYNRPPP